MGKFDFQFDPGLIKQMEKLADYDNIAPRLLEGAVPILTTRVKAEASKHRLTSSMYNSIKANKPKKNKYGWFVSVRPTGVDKNGTRNMEKMMHLEYGTSKITPKPMLSKALNSAEQEVNNKLQELFNEVIG
ncbi:HK97-gp10 family putative phage morphogenesis protein [Anaerosacchariphilus polymeriproducens]|uniref:HK97 gp10 family phage protein n=1 Tax=Anaerosacchariphilus polymeriproducens TaxID=1812858 RepID=A0A371AT76_9FIRM|nr:HK97-gp10 family putative phage morphogenesis protein [Anaerosacchariphilus polymeriproducens]RDU22761.1 hypothetical protein DWV06_13410 [Anaerosacchariphilus polymeriproducens]